MDRGSDDTVWSRMKNLFTRHHGDGDLDELEQAVMDASKEGELEPEEGSMILRILELDEMQVCDVMTPRTDFDCLPSGTSILETAKHVVATGHSRLPVFAETRDNIVGVAYAKDLLAAILDPARHQAPVDSVMRPAVFVPETKVVSKLLQEFRSRKNHLAIIVDEYGGTSGLVTIEDVIEQIVGEIEDEHDAPKEEDIQPLDNGCYLISGRAWLEDLEDIGMSYTSDEVDTIGGYLCLEAGHVPQAGESFVCGPWRFTVRDADVKQIRQVLAEPMQPEPEG